MHSFDETIQYIYNTQHSTIVIFVYITNMKYSIKFNENENIYI